MIEPDHFDEKLAGGGSGPTLCWARVRLVGIFDQDPNLEDVFHWSEADEFFRCRYVIRHVRQKPNHNIDDLVVAESVRVFIERNQFVDITFPIRHVKANVFGSLARRLP